MASAARTLDLLPRVRVGGVSGTTVGGFSIDMFDSAAVLGSFGYGDQLVSEAGVPYPRQLKVGGGTAVPDGAFVGIELEYFPLWESVPDSDQGDYDPGDRGLAQSSRWLVERASTIADDGTTITMTSGNPSVWTDVSFGSPTQYLQAATSAEPNDLVLVVPSFRLGTENEAVNFDARIVASSNRVSGNSPPSFSQSHNGVSGWRAIGADGVTRVVTGGVTYRVTADDLDDGVVTFRVSYKMQDVSASRELLASANTPARLDLINLGAAGLA